MQSAGMNRAKCRQCRGTKCITYFCVCPNITVAPTILEVVMAGRSSLDRRFVPFRGPNSHRTRTEHVQNEEYFSVRREPATVMLTAPSTAPRYCGNARHHSASRICCGGRSLNDLSTGCFNGSHSHDSSLELLVGLEARRVSE
jgi:hypothetical protein